MFAFWQTSAFCALFMFAFWGVRKQVILTTQNVRVLLIFAFLTQRWIQRTLIAPRIDAPRITYYCTFNWLGLIPSLSPLNARGYAKYRHGWIEYNAHSGNVMWMGIQWESKNRCVIQGTRGGTVRWKGNAYLVILVSRILDSAHTFVDLQYLNSSLTAHKAIFLGFPSFSEPMSTPYLSFWGFDLV